MGLKSSRLNHKYKELANVLKNILAPSCQKLQCMYACLYYSQTDIFESDTDIAIWG